MLLLSSNSKSKSDSKSSVKSKSNSSVKSKSKSSVKSKSKSSVKSKSNSSVKSKNDSKSSSNRKLRRVKSISNINSISKKTKKLKRIKSLSNLNSNLYSINSIYDFIEILNNKEKRETIKQIGKGGGGIVYINLNKPNYVYKVSNKNNTCRIWSKEVKIYKKLNLFNIDTKLCKILKMKSYIINKDICCLQLTRAFNPIDNKLNYTIQPQFQYDSFNYNYTDRGLFLGIKELLEYKIFTKDNIKKYIKDLGIVMSRLHYQIKNDGHDLELFISKKKNEDVIIYIGDFDLSENYKHVNENVIEILEKSLSDVPYFPIEGELYSIFSKNYLLEAKKYASEETALQVLKLYTQ
jgi:hypothetical protein